MNTDIAPYIAVGLLIGLGMFRFGTHLYLHWWQRRDDEVKKAKEAEEFVQKRVAMREAQRRLQFQSKLEKGRNYSRKWRFASYHNSK